MASLKLLVALCVLGTIVCGRVHYHGDKVFRITPRNSDEIKFVHQWIEKLGTQLDVWREPSIVGENIDIHARKLDVDEVKETLMKAGLTFKVIIEDLEKIVKEEQRSNSRFSFFSSFSYERYNRLKDINAELTRLENKYANVERFVVGRSYENREIVGVKVFSAPNSNGRKQAVWVDGGIHAREWIAPATVLYLLKTLLSPPLGSDTDDSYTRKKVYQALQKYDFYILPVFNVDGYEYTHTRNRMWRKTRSRGRTSWCYGADPNRNWDSHFGGAGTSSNPCSDIYRGPSAFSEVEVKQVAAKLSSISRGVGLKSYWNVHAYSQLLLYPLSYTTSMSRDNTEIARVADVFAGNVSIRYGKIFKPGQPSRILYSVAGGSIDWTYEKLGVIYSYAPELRPGRNSYNGFVLPASQIRESGLEFTDGFLSAVNKMK